MTRYLRCADGVIVWDRFDGFQGAERQCFVVPGESMVWLRQPRIELLRNESSSLVLSKGDCFLVLLD